MFIKIFLLSARSGGLLHQFECCLDLLFYRRTKKIISSQLTGRICGDERGWWENPNVCRSMSLMNFWSAKSVELLSATYQFTSSYDIFDLFNIFNVKDCPRNQPLHFRAETEIVHRTALIRVVFFFSPVNIPLPCKLSVNKEDTRLIKKKKRKGMARQKKSS